MFSFPEDSVAEAMKIDEAVRVFGPASLSNLGPGFDTLGLCLQGVGDVVEAVKVDKPGIHICFVENDFGGGITTDPVKNTAGVAAQLIVDQVGYSGGVSLTITKGFKPGSGIGSSAASAVAAAFATSELLQANLEKQDLVDAVLGGEAIASGARHGDNVLPALFGGLILVSSSDPTVYRNVLIPTDLWIVTILPDVEVLTKQARAMLPAQVQLQTAVNQASSLAFMIDAFHAGDWRTVGRWMMEDKIAEPVRSTLVPCYTQIKAAALDAGAYGCALTGSGPAMFAITSSQADAKRIAQAMFDAGHAVGVSSTTYISQVNQEGVCRLKDENFSLPTAANSSAD